MLKRGWKMGTTRSDGEATVSRTKEEKMRRSTRGIGAVMLYCVDINAARDDERLRELAVRRV